MSLPRIRVIGGSRRIYAPQFGYLLEGGFGPPVEGPGGFSRIEMQFFSDFPPLTEQFGELEIDLQAHRPRQAEPLLIEELQLVGEPQARVSNCVLDAFFEDRFSELEMDLQALRSRQSEPLLIEELQLVGEPQARVSNWVLDAFFEDRFSELEMDLQALRSRQSEPLRVREGRVATFNFLDTAPDSGDMVFGPDLEMHSIAPVEQEAEDPLSKRPASQAFMPDDIEAYHEAQYRRVG